MIFGLTLIMILAQFSFPICNEYMGKYYMSSYYHPVPGQTSYFYGNYWKDKYVNCSGNCNITSSGYKLTQKDAHKIAACPSNFRFKTRLLVLLPYDHPAKQKRLYVQCEDRGGSIKRRRLDLWIGFGEKGKKKPWIQYSTRNAKVFKCF